MTLTLMNPEAVDAATEPALDRGIRVFNSALFGATEAEHVAVLLAMLDPLEGAAIIDAGCGVGEMARLMREARPDLDFLLVNASKHQLALCPEDFDRLQADFHAMTDVPDNSADAIVFSFALCHSPLWNVALEEAYRVLKPGGTLLINDMARLAGNNDEAEALLGARFFEPEWVEAWAREAGFALEAALAPGVCVDRMAELLAADGIETTVMDGLIPTVWKFTALAPEVARWTRHEGAIAFQFSGGRDSTAALYLLREHWPKMRVYHLDTGDQFPETKAVVDRVRQDLADAGVVLDVITQDVEAFRVEHGYASDLVPTENTAIGRTVSGRKQRLVDRYVCCASNLMNPMHSIMVEERITLIVRGQRDDEYDAPPMRDGDTIDGFEVHYPIQDWTAGQVDAYLAENGLPVAPFYAAGMRRAPECMHCTAWLDEGRLGYLKARHPDIHPVVIARMKLVRDAVTTTLINLDNELEA